MSTSAVPPVRLIAVWAPIAVAAGELPAWKSPGTRRAEEIEALLARRARRARDRRIQRCDIRVDDADHVWVDVSAGLAPAPPCWCGQVHGTVQPETTYEGYRSPLRWTSPL
jgi:hypothetical protein